MALKNITTGEYLKIVGAVYDFATKNYHYNYYIFANQEQRQRYESGLSEYEVYKTGMYNGVGVIENILQQDFTENTLKNTIIASGYVALKQDMFNDWDDA